MTGERGLLDLAVSLCEGRVPLDDAIPAVVRAAGGSTTLIQSAANRATAVSARNPHEALARRVALLLDRAVEEAAAHEWEASADLVYDVRAPMTAPSHVDRRTEERDRTSALRTRREGRAHRTVAEYLADAARVTGAGVIDLEKAAAAAAEHPRRTLADALADAARRRGDLLDLRDRPAHRPV
jgi:hypothetical protein